VSTSQQTNQPTNLPTNGRARLGLGLVFNRQTNKRIDLFWGRLGLGFVWETIRKTKGRHKKALPAKKLIGQFF